jgi:hypothetical protein
MRNRAPPATCQSDMSPDHFHLKEHDHEYEQH